MIPGVLIAWVGSQPTSRVVRIPPEGLVIGRELIGDGVGDDKISRQHARITQVADAFAVEDLASRNGTFVEGARIPGDLVTPSGTLVRTGRTVVLPFTDIEPFEAATGVTTHENLTAGRRTIAIHGLLDAAARAGRHVVIAGPPGIGRGHLARSYAARLASPLVPRLQEDPIFGKDEVPALLDALATSPALRLVFTRNHYARPLAAPIEEFLAANALTVEVPSLRYRADEVARVVQNAVKNVDPELECHHSLFEHTMLRRGNLSEITLGLLNLARIEHGATIRAEDLEAAIRRNWVQIGGKKPR